MPWCNQNAITIGDSPYGNKKVCKVFSNVGVANFCDRRTDGTKIIE